MKCQLLSFLCCYILRSLTSRPVKANFNKALDTMFDEAVKKFDAATTCLQLEKSRLTNVGHSLAKFKDLKSLQLYGNCISFLPDDFGMHNPHLKYVNLGDNLLRHLPLSFTENLRCLEKLDLTSNMIETLPLDFGKYQSCLKILNLGFNKLCKLENDFGKGFNNLSHLNLASNQLTNFPPTFNTDFGSLENLYLDSNKIKLLDTLFGSNMTNLRVLSLFQTEISYLPSDLGCFLTNLQYLHLGGNKFELLPECLYSNFNSLMYLNLSDNSLLKLSSKFGKNFVSLETLDLSANQLSTLPKNFLLNIINLKCLNLKKNKLKSIPNTFRSKHKSLEDLDLSHNQIKSVFEGFGMYFESLTSLKLANNGIRELPLNFGLGLCKLKTLDLSDNDLQSLPRSILKLSSSLDILDIRFNYRFEEDATDKNCIGLTELKKYFGSKLLTSKVSYNPEQLTRKLNSKRLVWNRDRLRKATEQEGIIDENELRYQDFCRIISKIEKFEEENDQGTSVTNLFSCMYKNSAANSKTSNSEYKNLLLSYIQKLFDPDSYCKKWILTGDYRKKTLSLMSGIFKKIDGTSDILQIQNYLKIILGPICRCDQRQYNIFRDLNNQIYKLNQYSDSCFDYVNFFVCKYKHIAFHLTFDQRKPGKNINLENFWYSRLHSELGLKPKEPLDENSYDVHHDPFKNNNYIALDAFFTMFTPEYMINSLVRKINSDIVSNKHILDDMILNVNSNEGFLREKLSMYPHIDFKFRTDQASFHLVAAYLLSHNFILVN